MDKSGHAQLVSPPQKCPFLEDPAPRNVWGSVMCNREWTTITQNALQPISCKQAARMHQTQYRIKVGSTDAAALGPFKK